MEYRFSRWSLENGGLGQWPFFGHMIVNLCLRPIKSFEQSPGQNQLTEFVSWNKLLPHHRAVCSQLGPFLNMGTISSLHQSTGKVALASEGQKSCAQWSAIMVAVSSRIQGCKPSGPGSCPAWVSETFLQLHWCQPQSSGGPVKAGQKVGSSKLISV